MCISLTLHLGCCDRRRQNVQHLSKRVLKTHKSAEVKYMSKCSLELLPTKRFVGFLHWTLLMSLFYTIGNNDQLPFWCDIPRTFSKPVAIGGKKTLKR